MSSIYAMQRANGDWFAVRNQGRLRMPVFRSMNEAMQARGRNLGMLLFKPVILDELALLDLASAGEATPYFLLVEDPLENLNRSSQIDHKQLVLLMQELNQPPQDHL